MEGSNSTGTYRLVRDVPSLAAYLRGADRIAFDLETSPLTQYRSDPKAALDANRSEIKVTNGQERLSEGRVND